MATSDAHLIPGQVPITVDNKYALTIENFGVQMSRASEIATGSGGNFGFRQGVPQYTFSFEMPPMATNPTAFEVALSVLTSRKNWTYKLGTQTYVLMGAAINSEDLSVAMQQGNTRCTFRGNALKRVPE